MPNIDHFRLDSDYPMDKIVYFKEGTFTPNNGSVSFSHGLSFTPLVFGIISPNSNFSESYAFNSPVAESGVTVTDFMPRGIILLSNNTSICIYIASAIQSALSGTWYYRIYGFSNESSNITASETTTNAKKLILNSDYEYFKLYDTGSIEYSGSSQEIVHHNLGYRPYVMTWGRCPSFSQYLSNSITIMPYVFDDNFDESDFKDGTISIYVNSTDLVFNNLSDIGWLGSACDKVWYRIYANEA